MSSKSHHLRRAGLITAGVAVALLFFGLGALARLLVGPVSLGPFSGELADAISNSLPGLAVRYDDAALQWSRDEGRVNLVILGARVFDRSQRIIAQAPRAEIDLAAAPSDDLIASFEAGVAGAGYNTAQCAVLYARGYHCGVIPVDTGMVTKLAPLLGISLTSGPVAYEQLRKLLQLGVADHADTYRDLAPRLGYQVTIPPWAAPTWFVHLTLIYFKRLYLNRPGPDLCPHRPACALLFGCSCQPTGAMR